MELEDLKAEALKNARARGLVTLVVGKEGLCPPRGPVGASWRRQSPPPVGRDDRWGSQRLVQAQLTKKAKMLDRW